MADAQPLVDVLVVQLEGQHLARGEQLERLDGQLDGPGRELVVARRRAARDERPPRAHDALQPQGLRRCVRGRRPLGIHHELHDARAVAQVDEDQPAVIAAPADPARERELPARVLDARLSAQHVPVGAHWSRTLRST